MGISDKTRKVLWGRSGSRCAFCKSHLVIDASKFDPEAVVGDECHIVSSAPNGPRHDPSVDRGLIDDIDNLILLCRVHHKLVDDQPETFLADTLKQLKANHERWVNERLSEPDAREPIRIVRSPSEIPEHLALVSSAKMLLDVSRDCHGRYDDYPEDLSEDELDCVGSFLQNLTDWIDLGINEPHERISAQRSLAENMVQLEQAGLRVYCARERQEIRGGLSGRSDFNILHLRVVRHDDPTQMQMPTP